MWPARNYIADEAQPSQCFVHCAASKQDQQVKELGELLLRRRFLIKADRMFKKPKPGRKRLVKWPKKLVPTENPWVSLTEWLCSDSSACQSCSFQVSILWCITQTGHCGQALHAAYCADDKICNLPADW